MNDAIDRDRHSHTRYSRAVLTFPTSPPRKYVRAVLTDTRMIDQEGPRNRTVLFRVSQIFLRFEPSLQDDHTESALSQNQRRN